MRAARATVWLVGVFALLSGCEALHQHKVAERAAVALDLAEYRKELRACKELGKDAGSYAVYERCAEGVDKKHGVGR